MTKLMTEASRSVSIELPLDAALDDAWRALTDARELARWFPLDAKVQPGAGGTMEWTWADRFHWALRIDGWEPPRLLRLVQERERPRDVEGKLLPEEAGAPQHMMLEFTLETREGRTFLRLVHSGFGRGAGWDDELDSVTNGWNFELRSLAHYLARHRGRDRHVGWAVTTTSGTQAAAWKKLLGDGGFALQAAALETGRPYTVKTPDGDTLSGTIQLHIPDREFFGTARELGDGIFRLGTWQGGGQIGVHVWVATYAPAHEARAAELGARAQRFLDRGFPKATR